MAVVVVAAAVVLLAITRVLPGTTDSVQTEEGYGARVGSRAGAGTGSSPFGNTLGDSYVPVDRNLPTPGDGSTPGDPLSRKQIALLQPGDFILRRGDSLVSRLIVSVLGGEEGFSHSGILYRDDRGEWMVIHSVSRTLGDRDGVQEEPLRLFVRNSVPGSTAVVRLRTSSDMRETIVTAAGELLAEGAPFDVGFQLENGAIYCSELLWLALPEDIRHRTTVFQEPGQVIRFESFLDPQFFDLIVDLRTPGAPEL